MAGSIDGEKGEKFETTNCFASGTPLARTENEEAPWQVDGWEGGGRRRKNNAFERRREEGFFFRRGKTVVEASKIGFHG